MQKYINITALCLFGLCCTGQGSWMWQQNCNLNETHSAFVYDSHCIQSLPEAWRTMKCVGNDVSYKTCTDAKCTRCEVKTIPTEKCDNESNKITHCGAAEPDYGKLVNSTSYAIIQDSETECKTFHRTEVIPLNKCSPAEYLEEQYDKYDCKGDSLIIRSYSDPDCQTLIQTDKFMLNRCEYNGSQYGCVKNGKKMGN
jgi:hypothetical protein